MNIKVFKKALVCLTLAIPFATSSNYCMDNNNIPSNKENTDEIKQVFNEIVIKEKESNTNNQTTNFSSGMNSKKINVNKEETNNDNEEDKDKTEVEANMIMEGSEELLNQLQDDDINDNTSFEEQKAEKKPEEELKIISNKINSEENKENEEKDSNENNIYNTNYINIENKIDKKIKPTKTKEEMMNKNYNNINQINIINENNNQKKVSSNKIMKDLNEKIYDKYTQYLPDHNSNVSQKNVFFYSEAEKSAVFEQPSAPNGINKISIKYLLDAVTREGINLSENEQLQKFIDNYIKLIQAKCIEIAQFCDNTCNVEANIENELLNITIEDYKNWAKTFTPNQIELLEKKYQTKLETNHKKNMSRYSKFDELTKYLIEHTYVGSAYAEMQELYTKKMQLWADHIYGNVITSLKWIFQAFTRNDSQNAFQWMAGLSKQTKQLIQKSDEIDAQLIHLNYIIRSFKIWKDLIKAASKNPNLLFDELLDDMEMYSSKANYQFSQYK